MLSIQIIKFKFLEYQKRESRFTNTSYGHVKYVISETLIVWYVR